MAAAIASLVACALLLYVASSDTHQTEDTMNQTITFKDADQAFEQAISEGRLSANPKAANYAGHYMYMGTSYLPGDRNGFDAFKHCMTREYIA